MPAVSYGESRLSCGPRPAEPESTLQHVIAYRCGVRLPSQRNHAAASFGIDG